MDTKAASNEKTTEIEIKYIPDSVCFYTTFEFHRLANISFNDRMRKGAKFLSYRISVDTALDIGDKNGWKKKTSNV